MLLKQDSIDDRIQRRSSVNVEAGLVLSLRRKPPNGTLATIRSQRDSSVSPAQSSKRVETSIMESPIQLIRLNNQSLFAKAAKRRLDAQQVKIDEEQAEVEKPQQEQNDKFTHIEELKNVIAKHMFINKWYQGPTYERANETYFIKDDKIIIIDDDDDVQRKDTMEEKEEMLGGLVSQHINPTKYVMGDKKQIWEEMKALEDKQNKLKKENETKKLIKNSDVKMTIYPAYDNFFKKS